MNAATLRNFNSQTGQLSPVIHYLHNKIATPKEASEALASALKNKKRFRYEIVFYALKNIKRYFGSNYMKGLQATDVVQIVLEKIITGVRHWNKSEMPDICKFILVTIHSYIRNEKIRTGIPDIVNFTDLPACEFEYPAVDGARSEIKNHHNKVFASDAEMLCERLLMHFDNINDVYAYYVLQEVFNGAESNIEIAEELDINIREVENAKKRIRRKAKQLLNKQT